jgi:hypothetical protein
VYSSCSKMDTIVERVRGDEVNGDDRGDGNDESNGGEDAIADFFTRMKV